MAKIKSKKLAPNSIALVLTLPLDQAHLPKRERIDTPNALRNRESGQVAHGLTDLRE